MLHISGPAALTALFSLAMLATACTVGDVPGPAATNVPPAVTTTTSSPHHPDKRGDPYMLGIEHGA